MTNAPRYSTVVLDADSTLSALEGIDWLAERRGPAVAEEVAGLTTLAMQGELSLDLVYERRLELVRPTHADLEALGTAYVQALVPGAADACATLREAGVSVHVISGGLRVAVERLADAVGVASHDVHAVDVDFAPDGAYAGVDATQPLATQHGKQMVLAVLELPRPVLMVGDGSTDAAARAVTDGFAAFTGVVRRDAVVAKADHVVGSFADVVRVVLGPSA